jgi:uncharacterized membrane protein
MATHRDASQPNRDTTNGAAAGAVITVNESVLKWVQFVSIMLYVLVAGVMWGTWLSLARTMTNYDAATFLADGKHMIENLAMIMAVLMISAVVIGLVAVVLLFRSPSTVAAWLAAIGLLLMIAVLVITVAVEVPIDNVIATWTEATLPADWQQIRARWSTFHTLRTFVALGAVAAAVAAGLTVRSAAREQSLPAEQTPVAPAVR